MNAVCFLVVLAFLSFFVVRLPLPLHLTPHFPFFLLSLFSFIVFLLPLALSTYICIYEFPSLSQKLSHRRLNGRPAMLPRATEEPNQETHDREEEDQKGPKNDDDGRLPAATHLV